MRKIITFLLFISAPVLLLSQNCRYTNRIFEEIDVTKNIIYANAPALNAGPYGTYHDESNTTNIDLKLDIHQPLGDSFTNRPAIIFIHGGAFVSGNKNHDDMKGFCDTFALRGYVTATIQYRLGMNVLDATSATRAVYRGLQDGRSAVRYLRENAAEYGIDPNSIYMAGSSAGGYIALQSVYMDDVSEKPSAAGTYQYNDPTDLFPPYAQITAPNLGDYDIGSFTDKKGKPDAVVSFWGAIKHSDLITQEDSTPVFLVHGKADEIVPFGIGSPFNLSTFPPTYGSKVINDKLDNLGLTEKKTYFVDGEGHEFYGVSNGMWSNGTGGNAYWGIVVDKSVNFFYQQHKPRAGFTYETNNLDVSFENTSQKEINYQLWNFGDGNSSIDENPVYSYSLAGTYQVDLYVENSVKSWDTISHYITVESSANTITFYVNDDAGPVQGAEININSQTLTTGSEGVATIDLEDGNYGYTVKADGYEDDTGNVEINGAAKNVDVLLTVTPPTLYTVTFQVNDDTGPVQGAEIGINSQTLTTGSEGVATIDLEDGNYGYTVKAEGYDDDTGNVEVSGAAKNVDVLLTVTPTTLYTVTFQVNDDAGPVQGAEISINSQTLTTDADGLATIDLEDGHYVYTVTANGYDDNTGNVEVSGAAKTVDILLTVTPPPANTVTFRVSDETGPVEGAEISINSQTLTTDAEGVATIDLEDGNYDYTVTANGYDEKTGEIQANEGAIDLLLSATNSNGMENIKTNNIKIYPNPVSDKLYIEVTDINSYTHLKILNLVGKIMAHDKIVNTEIEIDISDYYSGLYFIVLKNKDIHYTKKIMIH